MKLDELLAGTPLDSEQPFSAPWEARAFAMAVRLSEAGVFSWDEFRSHLIEQIGIADKAMAHGWEEPGDGYYTHFLSALEKLLRTKGIVDPLALEQSMQQISSPDLEDH
jgi:nitrile hydratase accessory protein